LKSEAGLRRKRIDLERGTVPVAEQLLEVNGTFSVGPPKSAAGRRMVTSYVLPGTAMGCRCHRDYPHLCQAVVA
jgi:hypothetical protein